MHNDAMLSYLQNFKYELAGLETAPKLVFLHGLMGSAANWRRVAPPFHDKFQVLTYDQRGHGSSLKPKSGYAPSDYAQDLKLILDELGWDKIVLVGHSMGGRNALAFAALFPERLIGLVVEDIGPSANPAAMQRTIDLINRVPTPFSDKNAAKKYLTGEFVESLPGRPDAKILGQYFYTNIETRADGLADWRFSKTAILSSLAEGHGGRLSDDSTGSDAVDADQGGDSSENSESPLQKVVRELSIPTLFIRGETSSELSRAEYERVLAANSNIEGVEIAGAGHWVHSDKPVEFIQALQSFFTNRLGF